MRSRSYTGKSSYGGSDGSLDSRQAVVLRVLFFPLQFLFLELVLHLYMGAPMGYFPVWAVFALSAGLLFSALALPFTPLANNILSKVFSVLFPLIYVVEMIAKTILQSYYPLSFLGTAAGNRLTDYMDVIAPTVLRSLPIIVVLYIPTILLFLFGNRLTGFEKIDVRAVGLVLAGAVVLHLVGFGVVHLPWSGDLTPARLYQVDTNLDDQVEQLGLWTMLRLDIQHMFFRPSGNLDSDFSGLDNLNPGEGSSSGDGDTSGSEASFSGDVSEPTRFESPYHVMDVDLEQIAASAENEDIQWLAKYFNSVSPTKKNEYTGMFEGYNVIFFTLEGFSGYAIDPELTPTLYKLTHEGFVFNNFYTALHFTSTSGGECQNLLGLYPKNGSPATMTRTGELGTNTYFSLAQQLGREGYQVLGYHGNYDMYGRLVSHTNLGYDWRQFGHGEDKLFDLDANGELLWPQRDSFTVEASIEDYINSNKPFHVYYLTISGHMPYNNNRVVASYRDTVRELPYSEATQNYIATAMEVDKALETLIQKLDEAGKLDKTLIVAVPDHIPYFDVNILEELTGESFGNTDDLEGLREGSIDFDVYKNSLILWSASMEKPVVVDKVCCQVDILPTLSNLLGLEYDSRMLDGSDILSDSEGLVIFSSRCWRTDRGFYNRYEQTFTPAEEVTMTDEEQESYVSAMRRLVSYKLDSTDLLIENDFYNYVFGG